MAAVALMMMLKTGYGNLSNITGRPGSPSCIALFIVPYDKIPWVHPGWLGQATAPIPQQSASSVKGPMIGVGSRDS